MKILLIHNYYRYRGGEDRYMDILTDALQQKGHVVTQFLSDSQDIHHFTFWQKIMIPMHLISAPTLDKKLAQVINDDKPDIAIVHNLFPLFSLSLLKVLKQKGVPVLKRLENYKFLCLNGLFLKNNFQVCESCKQGNFLPGIFRRCYQRSFFNSLGIALSEFIHRWKKTALRNTTHFLASSQFVKSKFVDADFPAAMISVFPNFLDFEPLTAPVAAEDYVVYIGRLSQEKGLFTLLKAMRTMPELTLHILGNGPLEDDLKKFVAMNQMNHVIFHGFVDGLAKQEILQKALFLIFPSECYESFGYAVIESYACGVPVLASDLGGARELVKNGATGALFTPGDPDSLRHEIALLRLNDSLKTEMRVRALQKAHAFYTKKMGIQKIEALLQGMVHGKENLP